MIYTPRFYSRLTFLVFLATSPIQALPNQIDSLKNVLKGTSSDSVKVQTLHRLYALSDSVTYPEQALVIAERINYKIGISQAVLDMGRYYYYNGKPDVALSILTKSAITAEKIGAKNILISAYRYIGYIYRPNDPFVAEEYYNKSLKMARETGDEYAASFALSALGNVHEKIFEGNSADNRVALAYYLQSLEIRERIGSDEEIASSLNETSRIYDVLGQHDKGLALRLKGLEIAKKGGSAENIIYLNNVLGNEYIRLHDFKKALESHLTAYNAAKIHKSNLEIFYDINKGIAYDYYSLGDIKRSNEFYRQSIAIGDSIKAVATKREYDLSGFKHNLEQEFEKQKLELKDAQIAKANAEADKQAAMRNASLIGIGLVLLLVIIVLRDYRQKQKTNRELLLKNLKIENAYKVLEESENKFKVITESINDVFYLYNIAEKKYEYISPNCNQLLGLDQLWIYTHNSMKSVVYGPDLPLANEATAKIEQGIPYSIEFRVLVDGEIKWVAEKSSPIYDGKGNLVRNSGICRNITSFKKAEEQIQQLNIDLQSHLIQIEKKNEELNSLNIEKDRFMGMVSHDIKNYISAMVLTLCLMERNNENLNENQLKYIKRLHRSVDNMHRLLGDFLTINRIQQGIANPNYSTVDLAKKITETIEEYNDIATQKNLKLKYTNNCTNTLLDTDSSYLSIIADNLISNAIKYSPKGGEIDVMISKQGDRYCVEVSDQGLGIPASDMPKLYGRFQKLTPKPTAGEPSNGLGLSIVKDLVDALNADIECKSTEGKGTTFNVLF